MIVNAGSIARGGSVGFYSGEMSNLLDDMQQLKPTGSPPRNCRDTLTIWSLILESLNPSLDSVPGGAACVSSVSPSHSPEH